MATKKKEVTKVDPGTIAEMPSFLDESDIGGGMEGADKDSYAIPFLRILQQLSPQVNETDAEYVEGAKAGNFFNSVSRTAYDGTQGVIFVPCAFERRFIKWAARGEDGGYKGSFLPEEVTDMIDDKRVIELDGALLVANEKGEVSEKRSDRMTDTRSHYGLLITPTGVAQVLLSLNSTQIKKSKQLMSILSEARVAGPNGLVKPPTWLNKIRLTTVKESNDQGSWHGLKVEAEGFVDDKSIYDAGKDFHASIKAGETKVNYDTDATVNTEADGKF